MTTSGDALGLTSDGGDLRISSGSSGGEGGERGAVGIAFSGGGSFLFGRWTLFGIVQKIVSKAFERLRKK